MHHGQFSYGKSTSKIQLRYLVIPKLQAPMVKYFPGFLVSSELTLSFSRCLPVKDMNLAHPITSPSCGYFPGLK